MQLLAKFVHGSHLYKLNTPESDMDYKGVYMPSVQDMFMGNVKDTINMSTNKTNEKNSRGDVDYEVYSLQKFVSLLCKGEMVTFDMLFAEEDCVEYYDKNGNVITDKYQLFDNPVWLLRNSYRHYFCHSDMKAYLGYCRKQAAKYGIKGSRLSSLRDVKTTLEECLYKYGDIYPERLSFIKSELPTNEYLQFEYDHYEVLGKKHQWTTSIGDFIERIDAEIDRYGNRAILAEKNEGIDWKAVSHAFRAGYQIQSMLLTGEMFVVLPDEHREFILEVKTGRLDWLTEVKPRLEELMDMVDSVAQENPKNLPEKPDVDYINKVLVEFIADYYDITL